MYIRALVWTCEHRWPLNPEEASAPSGLGLQLVESHLAWLLGTKLQSSATDMSLAPCLTFKEKIIAQLLSQRGEKVFILSTSETVSQLQMNDTSWIFGFLR